MILLGIFVVLGAVGPVAYPACLEHSATSVEIYFHAKEKALVNDWSAAR